MIYGGPGRIDLIRGGPWSADEASTTWSAARATMPSGAATATTKQGAGEGTTSSSADAGRTRWPVGPEATSFSAVAVGTSSSVDPVSTHLLQCAGQARLRALGAPGSALGESWSDAFPCRQQTRRDAIHGRPGIDASRNPNHDPGIRVLESGIRSNEHHRMLLPVEIPPSSGSACWRTGCGSAGLVGVDQVKGSVDGERACGGDRVNHHTADTRIGSRAAGDRRGEACWWQ